LSYLLGVEYSPGTLQLDISLFGHDQRIVDFYSKISDSALQFRMAKEKLHRSQVFGLTVDDRDFRSPE